MNNLEQYYPGDTAWKKLVLAHEELWSGGEYGERLIRTLHGKRDIAIVVFGHFNKRALSWANEPVPALDGLSPANCIANNLEVRLKSMLMRM